jgi:hypothetical protein
LNRRIRPSYACVQLISLPFIGVLFAALANPLAFICRFIRIDNFGQSPLGTAFINFGRDYPNQTFAGFIAAGSKLATAARIAALSGKLAGIIGKI